MVAAETPLMQQWREIKARHADSLVFFRVGDFYEMFYEDAEEGARLLDLTLTSRNNGSSRAPLAGIPVHAVNTYLQRLVRLGRRVAICEQVEDPSQATGIVRREVVETISPGTVLVDSLLHARRNNFLAAVAAHDDSLALAWADLSTGEFWAQLTPSEDLAELLARIDPAEILLPRAWESTTLPAAAVRTFRPDWLFDGVQGEAELRRQFNVVTLSGFGLEGEPALIGACAGLVSYLQETQSGACAALRPPRVVHDGGAMRLDEMTRRNLELVEPLNGNAGGPTLLSVLDEARTPMGARLLRRWLLSPLTDACAIRGRQQAVTELVENAEMRRAVCAACSEIRDQERLAAKIASARCTPRDLLAVHRSLTRVPLLREGLAGASSALLREQLDGLDPLPELTELIGASISPEAPIALADGSVIRSGYAPELDELRAVRDGAVDWIARMQAQERERTGIASLRVGFNKVFGYFIEVTRANLDRVPPDYQRKQTLANAERYVTPALKEWEERVLTAEERILEVESRIFQGVREAAARLVPRLQRVAEHIAVVDVLAGLAEVAVRRDYRCPTVDDGCAIRIRGGRHPVVETMMPREEFIPNDVELDTGHRVMILTGPNMAGKSTVLRQVGLISLMAQIGSFVPVREAHLGVVDRIFTRVGASDNLVRGQSTFMVEMTEAAAILNSATARSLVLLDEIGRGTSTWDGLSVATAVTEFLHDRVGAKTIFATHYHEMTRLAERLSGVVNFSVAVREEGNRIVFVRTLLPGGADRSYGVEVARLAGLPAEVIERARHLLQELERPEAPAPRRPRGDRQDESQLALFQPVTHPVVERMRAVDPNHLTPIQALTLLAELVEQARS